VDRTRRPRAHGAGLSTRQASLNRERTRCKKPTR
jgi:hypothetical protein